MIYLLSLVNLETLSFLRWVRLATTGTCSLFIIHSCTCDDEHSIVYLFLWPSLPPGWVRLATMSIQLFIFATLSSSWLSQACDDEHSIVCLFLRPSLPPGWVRLAMMSIQLFVYSCDPLFLLVELGLRRGAFNCLFILVTLSSSWLS